MGLSSFLYNIFIYPIEFILETSFYFFKVYTKSSYIVSIFFISLVVNFISLPLYNIAERWQQKERDIQNKMKPMIDNIKAVFKGDQRYLLIRTCQRINRYKTIYAFRGTLGLLIQIPFFIAAYHFMNNLDGLEFAQFGYITNLAKPDAMLKIGNISINVLPFIMTAVSFLASLVYSKKLTLKEQLPLYVTNLIFLVLLYNSPAGLLFYWTVNCTFSLVKNIVLENYSFLKNKWNSFIENKSIMVLIKRIVFIIFSIFTVFMFVYTVLYFLRETVLSISIEKQYLRIFRIDVKTYKDVFSIWFILFAIIIYKKYLYKLFNIKLNNNFHLLISASISITLLAGLFIPSTLIASSGQEFNAPFTLILNNISKYIGAFFVYALFIYILFSDKVKNTLSLFIVYISVIFFVDTFIIVGNYGNISSNFIFENSELLNSSIVQILLNILFVSIFIGIIYILLKKEKSNIIINIYMIISLVLFTISVYDIVKINKDQKILSNIQNDSERYLSEDNYSNIFNLSKTGTNVFIILLDRASSHYVLEYFNDNNKLKNDFNGFILYTNVLSYSKNTVGSIPSLMGGYEYLPYEITTEGKYNLKDKYNESLLVMPKIFTDNGYKANIFNATFANLNFSYDTSIFSKYSNMNAYAENDNFIKFAISNLFNDYANETEEIKNILDKKLYNEDSGIDDLNIQRSFRFSIFRIIPSFLRKTLYNGADWYIYGSENAVTINNSLKEFSILNSLRHITSISENGNYFNFIHNNITHEPDYINTNLLPSIWKYQIPNIDIKKFKNEFLTRSYYANAASMKNIAELIYFLKYNNVYDNTKIIIISDHALNIETDFYKNNGIEFMAIYNALLMVKDFYSTNDFTISSNFMTVADLPYLSTKHLTKQINPFTQSIITNNYKNGELKLIILNEWQPNRQLENRFNFTKYYTVKGNIFDKNNWKLNTLQK
ncbi:YidC/Oxa1 family membrane protein insertase [uncultured Brachyspira sp.]|uniref:YidC/Oxa1 family membrane protein insertase n=1 Tax=uncultured Brachyspira sp. TaxID=221953 RepID=UPI00261468FF|nr:YidC/Oxa1 family membrane protein insertase [uncultured Brachyspira sp.]